MGSRRAQGVAALSRLYKEALNRASRSTKPAPYVADASAWGPRKLTATRLREWELHIGRGHGDLSSIANSSALERVAPSPGTTNRNAQSTRARTSIGS